MAVQSVEFHYGKTTIHAQYDTSRAPQKFEVLQFNLQTGQLEFYDENRRLLMAIKPVMSCVSTNALSAEERMRQAAPLIEVESEYLN